MKSKAKWKKYLPLILVGGMIPAVIILSMDFHLPKAVSITLVIFLSLAFLAMALWSYAHKKANGSEWWQDDSASGWRGY